VGLADVQYKLLAKSHLNFAPQDGIKKGATPGDAFELMLQEVQGITPSAAAGIAADHASFSELMEAFEVAERRGDAEEMLQDCEIRNLRNGVANGRRLNKVGPTMPAMLIVRRSLNGCITYSEGTTAWRWPEQRPCICM
jgi:hypothetical protein